MNIPSRAGSVLLLHLLPVLFLLSCKTESTDNRDKKIPYSLPMREITLDDLSAFNEAGPNWKIAGNVSAEVTSNEFNTVAGQGVLVNTPSASGNTHLFTAFEHGDLELELEFMMPKGSNSGLYFQGRYEIQLLDSWQVKNPTFADCGGIYQRWDENRPEGQQGFEGVAPRVNACKAPGLWQQLYVVFRAPRFDQQGNKIQNAKFEKVYLNGFLIHENVELTGPTRSDTFSDEKPMAPFMIQGTHGPLAIRNFRYKSYTLDSLKLENIRYDLYESSSYSLPDFSTLKLVKSDTASALHVTEAASRQEFFALIYNADLIVPVEGEYLFDCYMDEGGEVIIDGKTIIRTGNVPGKKYERGLINLTAGKHSFRINYFQATWSAGIYLFYEGPGISRKALGMPASMRSGQTPPDPIIIYPEQGPEMIRSFITYKGKPKTHVISVGDPKQVHYTFDLNQASLIKCWRGVFADASAMWHERGEAQLLQPGNFTIEPADGLPMNLLKSENDSWKPGDSTSYKFTRYTVDKNGYPSFHYKYGDMAFEDVIAPADDSLHLTRTIVASGKANSNMWYRIASGKAITQMPDGLYSIGGEFYLKLEEAKDVRISSSGNELIAPLLKNEDVTTIKYSIIW